MGFFQVVIGFWGLKYLRFACGVLRIRVFGVLLGVRLRVSRVFVGRMFGGFPAKERLGLWGLQRSV